MDALTKCYAIDGCRYLELCKPKVVALVLVTSIIGMFLSVSHWPPIHCLVWGNIGIALCASSAAVINHVLDRQIDAVMARTQSRPVAVGDITPRHALFFSVVLGVSGLLILALLVRPLTAWLTLMASLGYAVIYTVFLKRMTPQNIVIGGLAGALPPLLGWSAVTGTIDSHALLLVLIIFTWTPPHFWALALYRCEDYRRVNIPMLPVTHGTWYTKVHILLYTFLLVIASIFPWLAHMSGVFYLMIALCLGGYFIFCAVRLLCTTQLTAAIQTFRFSIIYLFTLFLALLVDHYRLFFMEI